MSRFFRGLGAFFSKKPKIGGLGALEAFLVENKMSLTIGRREFMEPWKVTLIGETSDIVEEEVVGEGPDLYTAVVDAVDQWNRRPRLGSFGKRIA